MVKAGIPAERMRLVAQSVKFPTAEAMFDFINQKYNEYLVGEGAKHRRIHSMASTRPWLFRPWLEAQDDRRALAKAIYALNYYQLGIIRNASTPSRNKLSHP